MKLSRRDLRRLGLPLAFMLMLMTTAAFLAWATYKDVDLARLERNAALTARNQVEQRLRQSIGEGKEIRSRIQTLESLQAAGIVGTEHRLDWMEMLHDIQLDLRIPGMKYEFGPQAPLAGGAPGQKHWVGSPQKIQFRLLHEEDLLNALDRIQRQARALVVVRRCSLSPLASRNDGGGTTALLGAECELQWLTIPDREAGKR